MHIFKNVSRRKFERVSSLAVSFLRKIEFSICMCFAHNSYLCRIIYKVHIVRACFKVQQIITSVCLKVHYFFIQFYIYKNSIKSI